MELGRIGLPEGQVVHEVEGAETLIVVNFGQLGRVLLLERSRSIEDASESGFEALEPLPACRGHGVRMAGESTPLLSWRPRTSGQGAPRGGRPGEPAHPGRAIHSTPIATRAGVDPDRTSPDMIRRAPSRSALPLLLAAVASAAPLVAQEAAPAPLETVRNFQVVSERLASSGQIGYDQIPLIAEQGYDVVINLAIADEERNGQEGFLVAQNGLSYVHIPVDWQDPKVSDVEKFLGVMEAYKDQKVYVHCFANMRASAFVYLHRVREQAAPTQAAREVLIKLWEYSPGYELHKIGQWRDLIARVEAAPH